MLKSSHEPPPRQANQTLQTIQVARQLSKEVTEKQLKPAIKAAVQQVEVAASNSRESFQDANLKTAEDLDQCGTRYFSASLQRFACQTMSMPLARRGEIFGVDRKDEAEAVAEADRTGADRAADDVITTAVEGIIENTRKKVVEGIIENIQKKVAYTTTYGTS